MYELLVRNVRGQVFTGHVTLAWEKADGTTGFGNTWSEDAIGAIETWLAQPKTPTARARADMVMAPFFSERFERYDEMRGAITAAIESAEAAAREGRS